ncbi:MAG: hypothetical protein KGH71_01760 [Candidatus Micrarchaeota archaeon]|nr:hypothetical protein [Candidatus Micrarchaeota archaeon]
MEEQSKRDSYREMLLLLILGSVLLIFAAVYFIQIFSVEYGVGAGAALQSSASNVIVNQSLQVFSSQLSVLNQYVLESYLALILGLLLALISVVLYIHRSNRYDETNRKYMTIHTTVTVVYIILFFIIFSGFIHSTLSIMVYLGYFGMFVCIITDIYFEYNARIASSRKVGVRAISINPDTPYTNLQVLKGQLFSKLKGNVRIVDKHFNSNAIANMHRLFAGELESIDSITVITSEEMLDSSFGDDYRDITKEFGNEHVAITILVMPREEAGKQHERFVFDDIGAFKIPPLNIINKKSEHVTKINLEEARRRFEYLSQRSTKIENFLLRQGKGE